MGDMKPMQAPSAPAPTPLAQGTKKRPPSKNYIAIFLVIAAVLAVYFLWGALSGANLSIGTNGNVQVNTPNEAVNTQTTINSDVQGIGTDLNDIGTVLGV